MTSSDELRRAAGAPRRDPESLRLAAVVKAFTDAGVDAFAGVRSALGPADRLDDQLRARQSAATQHERDLVDRLAAGKLDVDGAALELAATVTPGLDEVVARAVRAMRSRLAGLAVREAREAFDTLRTTVTESVAEAVAVGRRVVDVDAIVGAFKSEMYKDLVPPLLAAAPVHPDWPAAVTASARVKELKDLADMLPRVGGPSSTVWAARAIGEAGAVDELVPVPLHLAVCSGLGWLPGLYEVDGDGRPSDGGREARLAHVENHRRMAPLRSVIEAVVGGR